MKNGTKGSLAAFLLSLSLLAGGVASGDEIDLTGRWELLARGPEQAPAVWVFEKKDGEWTGTWLARGIPWPLVEFEVQERRVKFRITARPDSWFEGELLPTGELDGKVTTPGGDRRVVAKRLSTTPEPLKPAEPPQAEPGAAAGSASLD
jgi:hypothetical protein